MEYKKLEGAIEVKRDYKSSLLNGTTITVDICVTLDNYSPKDFKRAQSEFAANSRLFYLRALAEKLNEFGNFEESQ